MRGVLRARSNGFTCLLSPRCNWRGLSSNASGRRSRYTPQQEKLIKESDAAHDQLVERMQAFVPKFRLPPAPAPITHYESWVPAWHVSAELNENALNFRTRYYLNASGMQPPGASKVELVVQTAHLDLSALELERLAAVAGKKYNVSNGELKLTSNAYPESHRNKADLRRTLQMLLEDARENADSHSRAPTGRLPLAARGGRERWLPYGGLDKPAAIAASGGEND